MLGTANLALAEGGFEVFAPEGAGGLLWTVIIFLLSVPFIWIVVMSKVVDALEARDEQAAQAILSAEQASADAQKARAEVEVKLGEARAEASRLLTEARDRAGAKEREILDEANEESRAMVEAARRTIRAEQDKAISAIRDEVVDLSLNAATRVLERNVGSEDDRRLAASLVPQGGSEG